MKISAKGGGGFTGQAEHYEVDTARLANGEALEAMLRKLDFLEAPPGAVGADIPHWEVTIKDGPSQHKICFTEDGSSATAPWQSLIAALRNVA